MMHVSSSFSSLKTDIRNDPEDTAEKPADDPNEEVNETIEVENTTLETEENVPGDIGLEVEDVLEAKSPDIDLKEDFPEKPTVEKLSPAKPKAVKILKPVTEEEKRTARMKRFGEVTNEIEKKKLRAERFNTGDSQVTYNGKHITGDEMNRLKKRADRFGVVSPVIEKLDESDRKLKRQQRFGAVTSVSTKPLTDSLAARKKKRMERFGQV